MERSTDENTRIYRTGDFATICTLHYFNFLPCDFEAIRGFPSKVIVSFEHTTGLDKALNLLRSRELNVEPVAFLETTRAVRGRLRDCAT